MEFVLGAFGLIVVLAILIGMISVFYADDILEGDAETEMQYEAQELVYYTVETV